MRIIKSMISLCLFLLISSSIYAGEYREEFTETVSLDKGQFFSLKNRNGSIEVTSWNRNEVRIHAVKYVKTRDRDLAERMFKKTRIIIDESSKGVYVDTRLPSSKNNSDGFFDWLFDSGRRVNVSVRYEITVPRDIAARIKSTNGAIHVDAFKGDLEVRTTNGRISVVDSRGAIEASSTNGTLKIELVKLNEASLIDLSTTNGSIALKLPEDFEGEINARTTNGSVSSDFPIEVSGRLKRTRIQGHIGNGEHRCHLKTTNGSIKILQI